MKGLAESVKDNGVHQPALVRPREGGGYEIIAGHRRQRASELAGFANMPCIVRNMTDDEAILAMTDDNLRHREKILPMEKAQSLKMQVEAISHQGAKLEGVAAGDVGKRSTEIVGERNGMNYKQVQRYIRLTELVPELQSMVNEKKLSFTPAVEISFIKPKNQRFIAVSIEGEQASPSLSQAQELRKLDKDGKLNGDVIDGILSREKKEVDILSLVGGFVPCECNPYIDYIAGLLLNGMILFLYWSRPLDLLIFAVPGHNRVSAKIFLLAVKSDLLASEFYPWLCWIKSLLPSCQYLDLLGKDF